MNENKTPKIKDIQDKSFRVQLSDELRQEIENMAKKHGCYYGEKASMSKFLAKIATKQLMIREASPWKGQSDDNHLIDLHVKLPCNLNGLISKITGIFGNREINICKVISNENDSYSRFTLSCPKSIELQSLFDEIKNIKFKDVAEFNNSSKIIDFLRAVGDNLNSKEEDFLRTIGDKLKDEEKEKKERILNRYYENQIVQDLYLVLRFRIDIKNKPKELHNILEKLSKNKISIISIKIDTKIESNGDQRTNIINLLIGFHPSKTNNNFINTNDIINFFIIDLKKEDLVEHVALIDVNDDSFDE